MWINYSNSFSRKIQNTEIYMDLSDLLRSKVFEKKHITAFCGIRNDQKYKKRFIKLHIMNV